MPSGNTYVTLGALDYSLGDKPAALADLRKAIGLDPNIRRLFEAPPADGSPRGQRLRAILEDQEFLKQLLQGN